MVSNVYQRETLRCLSQHEARDSVEDAANITSIQSHFHIIFTPNKIKILSLLTFTFITAEKLYF